ncbi:MAG: molecular chaperone [Magnetococcales bacterium]|nr:molecular chaperone [Magnetococcales bacterium]
MATQEEEATTPAAQWSLWKGRLDRARRESEAWIRRGERIVERYRDDRAQWDDSRRLNILWSNIQTLLPAMYARAPKPRVRRRFKDADPVARLAAELLERAVATVLDEGDFHQVMGQVVLDLLLVGRGSAWLHYVPHWGPELSLGEEPGLALVTREEIRCEYVPWQDFLHGPGTGWRAVAWVARRVRVSRSRLIRRFGAELASRVRLDFQPLGGAGETGAEQGKATLWEIWDRESRQVLWLAEGFGEAPLEVRDDPLGLKDFFPCPRPMLATTTNDSLLPVPDFTQYQDQAAELDVLTDRIRLLARALKVVGVYDASMRESLESVVNGDENRLIPVDQWAVFAQGGGVRGHLEFMPVAEVASTLAKLIQVRDRAKQDLYEVTGLADVIRGATRASETATAQSIKNRWGTLRLRRRQDMVQDFARDLVALAAEVMAEQFEPATLLAAAGWGGRPMQDHPHLPAALELLRDQGAREFRIDVETDSTLMPDEEEERQNRITFLQNAGVFLRDAVGLAEKVPALTPLLTEMLLFGVRAFASGRPMEERFEEILARLEEDVAARTVPPGGAATGAEGPDLALPGNRRGPVAGGTALQPSTADRRVATVSGQDDVVQTMMTGDRA